MAGGRGLIIPTKWAPWSDKVSSVGQILRLLGLAYVPGKVSITALSPHIWVLPKWFDILSISSPWGPGPAAFSVVLQIPMSPSPWGKSGGTKAYGRG
jgi:hypothetical protein